MLIGLIAYIVAITAILYTSHKLINVLKDHEINT
jgi:hypothetical protein